MENYLSKVKVGDLVTMEQEGFKTIRDGAAIYIEGHVTKVSNSGLDVLFSLDSLRVFTFDIKTGINIYGKDYGFLVKDYWVN